MNKSMLELRHAMETKLRRELTGLDINFQREAFQALHERQKQAMFENAKLKDEVALQGVGIANLSARLAKQKILQNKCQKHLQFLNAKVSFLSLLPPSTCVRKPFHFIIFGCSFSL